MWWVETIFLWCLECCPCDHNCLRFCVTTTSNTTVLVRLAIEVVGFVSIAQYDSSIYASTASFASTLLLNKRRMILWSACIGMGYPLLSPWIYNWFIGSYDFRNYHKFASFHSSTRYYKTIWLSSGGYMAVQVHVAFSSFVNGSAIFAGVSLTFFEFDFLKKTLLPLNFNLLNPHWSLSLCFFRFYLIIIGSFLLCWGKCVDCPV